ncbi:hypothetical protein EDE12_102251 [Methylosinus sp. sav-2]|nr:hypothetical protein EDE12_102251 [Methylosinus sp. sav-2]
MCSRHGCASPCPTTTDHARDNHRIAALLSLSGHGAALVVTKSKRWLHATAGSNAGPEVRPAFFFSGTRYGLTAVSSVSTPSRYSTRTSAKPAAVMRSSAGARYITCSGDSSLKRCATQSSSRS